MREVPPRAAGYVLGGGQSRRFGRDKALVVLDGGRTLSEHAAAALPADLAAPATLVVADVQDAHRALALRIIADETPGLGPAGGLQTALHDAAQRGLELIVVVACDMPWLDAELLAWQRDALAAVPAAAACVPHRDGATWEPLHAVYRVAAAAPRVDELVARGTRRMQALVGALSPIDAIAGSPFALERWQRSTRSANTPERLTEDPP